MVDKEVDKLKKEAEVLIVKAQLYAMKNPGKTLAIVGGVTLGLGLVGGFLIGLNVKK